MRDDRGKTLRKESVGRFDKAKGRLQRPVPEQQPVKTSNVVEAARKIIDPAQSVFRQFADDIQLKDLFAKAEALVAKANLTVAKAVARDISPTETSPNETPANKLPAKKASLKKAPSKAVRSKKPLKKKTPSKTGQTKRRVSTPS